MLNLVGKLTRELVAALSVLAMVFLSFADQPVAYGVDTQALDRYQLVDLNYCVRTPLNSDHGAHGPCHACRVSVADLPPAPSEAKPAYLHFVAFEYPRQSRLTLARILSTGHSPRAPPKTA